MSGIASTMLFRAQRIFAFGWPYYRARFLLQNLGYAALGTGEPYGRSDGMMTPVPRQIMGLSWLRFPGAIHVCIGQSWQRDSLESGRFTFSVLSQTVEQICSWFGDLFSAPAAFGGMDQLSLLFSIFHVPDGSLFSRNC